MDQGHPDEITPPAEQRRAVAPIVTVLLVLLTVAAVVVLLILLNQDEDDDTGRAAGGALSDEPSDSAPPEPRSSDPTSSRPDTTRPESTQPESTDQGSSLPESSKSGELPEALVGSWAGTVSQESSATTYTVEITLSAAPDADGRIGTVTYPTLDCSGHYTLDTVDEEGVTVIEHITVGLDNCLDGVEINLSPVDQDHLRYTFAYSGNPEDGVATLTRTG